MKKRILIAYGEKRELARIFGVSELTVYRAINFVTDTPLAKRIRKAAIERGGAVRGGEDGDD